MAVQITKRLLTVEEYHKMGEAGILQESGIELINGEIIEMSPIGSKQVSCVNKLNALLNAILGKNAIVSVQNPIITGDLSEPEPYISILAYREDYYAEKIPGSKDVLLVIEVADTSVEYDREVKLPQYAKSGIPEFWLVNLEDQVIEVHWQPAGDGYKFRELVRSGDILDARNIKLSIPVVAILG
ncbi:MAG: Uma2 family endonuclease [Lewinellaceae bacterium]|nr:Uma2 family endonuclease [Phaeodactylibacter sp.]MCB9036293.1 Uma2 family endonuclease [Lewinellaceae bacterium]